MSMTKIEKKINKKGKKRLMKTININLYFKMSSSLYWCRHRALFWVSGLIKLINHIPGPQPSTWSSTIFLVLNNLPGPQTSTWSSTIYLVLFLLPALLQWHGELHVLPLEGAADPAGSRGHQCQQLLGPTDTSSSAVVIVSYKILFHSTKNVFREKKYRNITR